MYNATSPFFDPMRQAMSLHFVGQDVDSPPPVLLLGNTTKEENKPQEAKDDERAFVGGEFFGDDVRDVIEDLFGEGDHGLGLGVERVEDDGVSREDVVAEMLRVILVLTDLLAVNTDLSSKVEQMHDVWHKGQKFLPDRLSNVCESKDHQWAHLETEIVLHYRCCVTIILLSASFVVLCMRVMVEKRVQERERERVQERESS